MTFGDDESFGDEGHLESAADVSCPYCGETIAIPLDPSGGRTQEYVEDCHVCCQPCRVRVSFDEDGAAEVFLEEAQ